MAENRTLNTRLRLKYDTAANWASKNPVLLAGEAGIESDTLLAKVGDGTHAWQQLGYLNAKYVKQFEHALTVAAKGENNSDTNLSFNGTADSELAFNSDHFIGSSSTNNNKTFLSIQLKKTLTDKINGALRFDIAQSLTNEQKAQARANIGASGSDTNT